MSILKEETEKSDLRAIQKSNEYSKTNPSHIGEISLKIKDKFSSFTSNKDEEIFGGSNTGLNNHYITSNNKNNFLSLLEESPGRFNFASSLISPTLDSKFRNLFYTPNKIISSELNAGYTATPNMQMEIKIDSPYYTNILNELKHDEKSSSFKRIKINHFPNEIMGRNINFDSNLDLEGYRNKNRADTASYAGNIYHNENKNKYKPMNINQNVNRFFNKNNINFSSEENSSDCSGSGEERVNPGIKTLRGIRKVSSMSNNSKQETSRKYTLQMRNHINFNTGQQEPNPAKRKLCCTCTKSRCLKKYCECFANNEFCDGCECLNCHNLASFNTKIKHPSDLKSNRNKANSEDKDEDQKDSEILCNCTKSNCTKKYCECFKAGEGCKELCRCLNCENKKKISRGYPTNKPSFSQDFPSINNSLYIEKRKANRNPLNYMLEGTSVYICNQDITVSFRKEVLNKNKEKDIINVKNHAKESDEDKINESANVVDLITKVTSKSGSSDKKNNILFDINTDSIISSSNNEKDAYSYNSSIGREFNYNSARKNTTKANLETPNINRKRKRITKADSFTKSSSNQLNTPLFATTTTSTQKKNNKKMVDLDQQIIKKLDKIY